MYAKVRGRIRGYVSTLRAGMALVHLNMIMLALTSSKKTLNNYADAVFKLYLQSKCKNIEFLELTDALKSMGANNVEIGASLIDVGGYRGRPDWERLVLASAVRYHAQHPCFEIGTAAGNTTVLLAHNTKSTVFTLDLPDSPSWAPSLVRLGSDDAVRSARSRAEYVRKYPKDNITELLGDSADFDYSEFQYKIGLFFVDGAHSLEYVRHDTFNASWCCRADGMIIWDDFTSSRDVTDFIRWLRDQNVALYGIQGTKLAFSCDIERIRTIASEHGAFGKS